MPEQGAPSTDALTVDAGFTSAPPLLQDGYLRATDPSYAAPEVTPEQRQAYLDYLNGAAKASDQSQRPSEGSSAPTRDRADVSDEPLIRDDGRSSATARRFSSDGFGTAYVRPRDDGRSSDGSASRPDGLASPSSGFGTIVTPAPVVAPEELTPRQAEEKPQHEPGSFLGTAYRRPEPSQAEPEPTAEEATAARQEASRQVSELPRAPLPIQQQKLESETPAAKSVQVDKALQELFQGSPNPAIVPQTASNRMDEASEEAMDDAGLSDHSKNVLRALNLSDSELMDMLRSLQESKSRR